MSLIPSVNLSSVFSSGKHGFLLVCFGSDTKLSSLLSRYFSIASYIPILFVMHYSQMFTPYYFFNFALIMSFVMTFKGAAMPSSRIPSNT